MTRFLLRATGLLCALFLSSVATDANAIDSQPMTSTTYYEAVMGAGAVELERPAGLPTSLYFSDANAWVEYSGSANPAGGVDWTARVRGLLRNHERIDTVYQMVAILPMPVDEEGNALWASAGAGIEPREGDVAGSVALIYGGEKVVLKRNLTLEGVLLPVWTGPGLLQLPDIEGTGYAYTLWDAIIRYDPEHGDTIQAFADLNYSTPAGVAPPEASDDRLKAYIVTWIPTLDPSVPPFTIRMDVRED